MFKKIVWILILMMFINCRQRDSILELPCEYFFNEYHIESTDITKYKSFTVFLNFVNGKTDGNLYFVSYDLIHFIMEINLDSSLCIDNSFKVQFFFNDGSMSDFFPVAENNCNGALTIQIKSLDLFKGKVIDGFQILGGNELYSFDLDDKTQTKYEKMSNCFFKIVNEKKH